MYSASFDKDRRLLQITFWKTVGVEDARACAENVNLLLADAQPGFRLLSDLSGLDSMDLACEPYIDQVMDACNRAGIEQVIRVVAKAHQDIGFGIMSLFHYRKNVRIVTLSSLEEAEAFLKA